MSYSYLYSLAVLTNVEMLISGVDDGIAHPALSINLFVCEKIFNNSVVLFLTSSGVPSANTPLGSMFPINAALSCRILKAF